MIDSKWDKRFMRIAMEVSTWSKDPSSKIGAVITNDEKRILSTGYNGFPRGVEDTDERLENREEKYARIIHAELNCLLNALYNGVSVKGGTIYIYGLPACSDCSKSIIQSGIKRVVIDMKSTKNERWSEHWETSSKPMFKEANVAISYLNTEHWNFNE